MEELLAEFPAQSSAEGDRLEMTKIKFEMLNEQHKKVSI